MKTAKEWVAEWVNRASRGVLVTDASAAVAEIQADALEAAAWVAIRSAQQCDSYSDPAHHCELFGCHSLVELASQILELKQTRARRLGE